MERQRKKWGGMLIGILTLLLCVTLSFAVLQFIPARADEPLVLPENTAEYTVADISSKSFSSYSVMKYNKTTNEWSSDYASKFELLLTVTNVPEEGTGSIAFEWKVAATSSSKKLIVKKYPKGQSEQAETLVEKAANSSKTYETCTIEGVTVDDQIDILYEPGTSTYQLTLRGLQMSTEQFEFTARIEEGAEHGTIKGDRDGETSNEQGELKFYRGYGDSFTLTAEPEEGYVAFWQRETDQLAYYSAQNTITVDDIQINSKGVKYYVRFLKLDDENPIVTTWQKPVENGLGWANEDGKYQAQNVGGIDYHSNSTLTVVAKGVTYLKFTYAFSSEDTTYASGNPNLKMTRNGQQDALIDSSLPTTYTLGSEIKEKTGYIHLSNEGLNVVDIQLSGSGAIGHVAPDGTTVYFKDFKVITEDELPETEVHFHYNPNYANLTINDQPIEETGDEIIDHVFVTKYAQPFKYSIKAKASGVVSSIDNQTNVSVKFVALNTNTDYDYWYETEDEIGFFTDGLVSNGGTKLVVNEDETAQDKELHLRFDYQEFAPKPTLTASKTADGTVSEIDIKDNDTVEFPYNKENSIIIRMHNFDKISADEITVKIDGEILPANKITKYNDYFGFVVDDVRQKTIEVSYQKEGYICTDSSGRDPYAAAVTFKLREVYEGGINDIVTAGDVAIENDLKTPWIFSSIYSEGDNYAFMAGNSKNVNGESSELLSGGGSSVLGFKLNAEEAGVLSFEFQMKGVYEDFMGMHSFIYQTLAYYRFTNNFSSNEKSQSFINNCLAQGVKAGKSPTDLTIDWEHTTSLLARGVDNTGKIDYGNFTKPIGGSDWYRVSIQVPQDNASDTLYLLFYCGSMADKSEQTLVIRNVNYISGTATASIEIEENGYGSVTAQLNGEDSKTATPGSGIYYNPAIGDKLTLTADPGENVFYGWTVNGEWLSEKPSIEYTVDSANTKIVAHIMPKGYYEARHGGTFYQKLLGDKGALKTVSEGQIVITSDALKISQSIEIPTGVSLILPYSSAGEYFLMGNTGTATTQISWATPELVEKYKYFTLTIESGATITIKGDLYIGGVLNYPAQSYQGHTSGAYSELINNGTINVVEGGVMDVYGRVTGKGSIDVASGAKLYEPFLILDFAGGTNTLDTFSANATPFKRYAMINIENPFTIHYGGQLIGHATLYALDMFVSLDQPFIGDSNGDGRGHDTMIMLSAGASVKAEYDPNTVVEGNLGNCTELIGRTKLTFTGGAKFSYMLFSAMGFEVPTTGVYFSIPYNFDIELTGEKAQYETVTDFMIMPGATVKVGTGATLTLNANVWVYDGLQAGEQAGKSYPSAEKLEANNLSKSGNLIVDGTLVMAKKNMFTSSGSQTGNLQPITFLGIIQTNGTGRIEIGEGVTLKGKIFDGLKDKNYFAYTTTARVWDKVHNCFGDLEAGHTYSATGGEGFTLTELKYTTAEGGDEDQTLPLNSSMLGSWKLDNHDHAYDWTLSAEEKVFLKGDKFKELERNCTALGCDEKETKLLLSDQTFSHVEYNGKELTDADLLGLLKELYGLGDKAETYGVQISAAETVKDAKTYTLTVTLGNGFFVDGTSTKTYEFVVDPFDLSKEGVVVTTDSLNGLVYNGKAQTRAEIVATIQGVEGTYTFKEGDVTNWQNNTNAGENTASVTINGTGNFTGSKTLNFSIAKKEITVSLNKQTAVYSGEKPTVSSDKQYYTLGGLVGVETGEDVNVTISFAEEASAWNVGTYTLTATIESTNYVLKADGVLSGNAAFEITAKSIDDATVELTAKSVVYNGAEQKLFKQLTLDGYTFTEGDYEVTYSGNTNAGTATVTVKGKGNFSGEATATFEITTFDISGQSLKATVTAPEGGFTYKGEKWEPAITFAAIDGVTGEVTYTLGYGENIAAGTGTVTVTGTNNFSGSFELTFDIQRATLTIVPDAKHSPMGQEIVALTATAQGLLACDEEAFKAAMAEIYSLSTNANKEAENTYDITVQILMQEWGSYTVVAGAKATYTVMPSVFANVTFEAQTSVYDGAAHTPSITLGAPEATEGQFGATTFVYHKRAAGGEVVTEIKDAGVYHVIATVTFTSSEQFTYTTTFETTFTIMPKSIEGAEIELEGDATYTGRALQPAVKSVTVDGLTLVAGEYSVRYSNNINAGDAAEIEVTATGGDFNGNFTGTARDTFTISPRSIEDAEVTLAQEEEFIYKGAEWTPSVTVTVRINERQVTLGTDDYELRYSNNRNAGEATVTVTGKGNYKDPSAAVSFTIKAKKIEVTLNDQTVTYSNAEPVLKGDEWRAASGAVEGQDDLQITLKAEKSGEKWNVGTYTINGTSANKNYEVTFTAGTLRIAKKAAEVTIEDKESVYGEKYEELTFTVAEGVLCAGDEKAALGVTLSFAGNDAERPLGKGVYAITGSYDSENYDVTFKGTNGTQGQYSVTVRKIKIAIADRSGEYKNGEFEVTSRKDTDWNVSEGSIVDGDDLHVVLSKAAGKDVNAEGYAITGTATNENYEVTWENGTFRVTKKAVTVEIEDQEAVYDYRHNYAFDANKWHMAEGTVFAEGEDKEVLGVTIAVTPVDAGKYGIAGTSTNGNYAVTFKGSYEGEEQGTYTVHKKDITDDALFMLGVEDSGSTMEGTRTVRTKYAGKTLTLFSNVTYDEGAESKTLNATLGTQTLGGIGEYTVTVTIEDKNYSGSAEFTVIVTDAAGYTQQLKETLARLEALAEGMDAEKFTEEDFADLKAMAGLINGLGEEEKQVAAEDLKKYEALIDAWNRYADTDALAETAEELAGSPIAALFEAAAALTALAGLAYIALKGGIL